MQECSEEKLQAHLRRAGIETASVSAFGYPDTGGDVRYDWHCHSYHQLLYSFSGTGQVEVGRARYFLPPQRAAWISAGALHRTTLIDSPAASVFFHPRLIRWKVDPIHIIAAPPLLREMVRNAARWPPRSTGDDRLRDLYFRTLALLCRDWLQESAPFWLPESEDPQLARAIDYTLGNLAAATLKEASATAAMSPRTFRRHFSASLALSWSNYLLKARMLRAMELLGRPRARVSAVATDVGYNSDSAFSKAFAAFTSESPGQYRARIVRAAGAKTI